MDFPADTLARESDDQYFFGKAFLVASVTDHKARSRSVYFPAPLERMPLFVRAGSIVPMGPVTLGA